MGIAWFLLEQGSLPEVEAIPGILPAVLAAVAVALVLGAPLVSRLILNQALSGTDDDVERKLDAYQSALIIGFAVREAAAVIGLVLTFLTANLVWVVPLAAVAVVSMLQGWPKREKLLHLLRGGPEAIG